MDAAAMEITNTTPRPTPTPMENLQHQLRCIEELRPRLTVGQQMNLTNVLRDWRYTALDKLAHYVPRRHPRRIPKHLRKPSKRPKTVPAEDKKGDAMGEAGSCLRVKRNRAPRSLVAEGFKKFEDEDEDEEDQGGEEVRDKGEASMSGSVEGVREMVEAGGDVEGNEMLQHGTGTMGELSFTTLPFRPHVSESEMMEL